MEDEYESCPACCRGPFIWIDDVATCEYCGRMYKKVYYNPKQKDQFSFEEIYKDIVCLPKTSNGLLFVKKTAGYGVAGIGDCRDSNVVVPAEHNGLPVISVEEGAFENCEQLESIVLPGSVKDIDAGVFAGCIRLQKMTLPYVGLGYGDARPAFYWMFGNLFSPIWKNLMYAAPQRYKHLNDKGEIVYSTETFYLPLGLYNVTITRGVITPGAFYQCRSLVYVTLDDMVSSIEEEAFAICSALRTISIGKGVSRIGDTAFYGCQRLTEVKMGDAVSYIGDNAFSQCESLPKIILGKMVQKIGEYSFTNCLSLKDIVLPGSLQYIGEGAFSGCESLEHINIPDSVANIGCYAFGACKSLMSVHMPENLLDLGKRAFIGCALLTDIVIPCKILDIPTEAFYGCNSLKSIVLPSDLSGIGRAAFKKCFSLKNVFYLGDEDKWGHVAIGAENNCFIDATIYFYREDKPECGIKFWHYDEMGRPVPWYE